MRLLILLSLSMLIIPVSGYSSDTPLSLSLSEAIRMAVEKNLDVRSELYNAAQFEADINRERAIYDPILSFQFEIGTQIKTSNFFIISKLFCSSVAEYLSFNQQISTITDR